MAKYYPKSQITPNLYTSGGEYMLSSNSREYVGFYYKVSNGEIYVGKTYTSISQRLVPLASGVSTPSPKGRELVFTDNWDSGEPYISSNGLIINEDYNKLKFNNVLPPSKFLPTPFQTTPTIEEFIAGEYIRYFAKRCNSFMYIEISKDTYNKIKANDPTIASSLYDCLYLPWSINLELSEEINRKMSFLLEKNNKWYGFVNYFNNNFSGEDTSSPTYLYTQGNEFLLPNRTNYVGFYHFMSNGKVMTGKYHGDGPELNLIQIVSTPTPSSSELTSTETLTTPPPTQTTTPSSGGGGGY